MINNKSVLALIPARGGSKRLPRKNIRLLANRPLIAYTIEAGQQSHYIDDLIVSTDDREIADIAISYGAQVPFIRPSALAQDKSSNFEVIQHALLNYSKIAKRAYDYIVYLQPSSPLRDYSDIDNAILLMQKKNADAVISVSETDHSPLWCNTLPPDLSMVSFLSEDAKLKRSQDLATYYRLNGAIYICKTAKILEEKTFFLKSNVFAYIMKPEKSIDIDTMLDFMLCETLLSHNMVGNVTSCLSASTNILL